MMSQIYINAIINISKNRPITHEIEKTKPDLTIYWSISLIEIYNYIEENVIIKKI